MSSITIPIPDSLRSVLGAKAPDESRLVRWSLEALVIEAYREGLLSRGKLGEILGLPFHEREAWLASRNVPYNYELTELEDDRRTIKDLAVE